MILSFEATRKWLLYTIAATIGFGVILSVVMVAGYPEAAFAPFNQIFWGEAEITPEGVMMQRWVFGVFGITIAAWAIAVLFLVMYPLKEKQMWAWNALTITMLFWWVLDSAISIYFGVAINALSNTVFFVAIMLPAMLLRKHILVRS